MPEKLGYKEESKRFIQSPSQKGKGRSPELLSVFRVGGGSERKLGEREGEERKSCGTRKIESEEE